jgi:hypothetical protein
MTVSIDNYGEVSMKLTDWKDVSDWLEKNPRHSELSFNEAIKLYIKDSKIIRNIP